MFACLGRRSKGKSLGGGEDFTKDGGCDRLVVDGIDQAAGVSYPISISNSFLLLLEGSGGGWLEGGVRSGLWTD